MSRNKKLGTVIGVFTPTILTILGVIMYLRFGWVLGQVGLLKTLVIVCLANSITLVTSLCLSAIATNTRVGVGGAYFIISRSLGLDIGGAIGVPLFLSQALSVTLYSFGLAESLRIVWPDISVPGASFVITLIVGGLAIRGAGFALKTQLPILVLIFLSIVALALGAFSTGTPVGAVIIPAEYGFWPVFAVFFPAVTGIMAGLSLSGDLRDPQRSIPRGTIAATLTGFAVYLIVPVILTFGAPMEQLRQDSLVWTRIAAGGSWLILPGLWGAIFSSAVGSMLGAPRTLQALAFDRLAPRLFRVSKTQKEPVYGILLTLSLALAAIFLGDLNTVAEVVTMFFLTVYGTVNLVAALESLSGNPSWRPKLKVPWWLSLLGALACFAVMILINLPASILALSIELAIWLWIKRRGRRGKWGSLWRDIYESIICWALFQLEKHPMTARNWRPHILVFSGNIESRLNLIRFADWFCEGRGLVTVCELRKGNLLSLDFDIAQRGREITDFLDREGIAAFGELDVVQNIERGMVSVAQSNGIAGISSNTIIMGWPDDRKRLMTMLNVGRSLQRLNKSLLIGHISRMQVAREGERREIHIWWGGLQRNGDLILMLAYLLTRNPQWRNAKIRLMSVASNPLMKEQTERLLERLVAEIRIEVELNVMSRESDLSIMDMIHRESVAADLVLLGLDIPVEQEVEAYAQRLGNLVDGLNNFFLVKNNSLFIGELISPDKSAVTDHETLPK